MKNKTIGLVIILSGAALAWWVSHYYSQSAVKKPEAVWVQASKVKESSLPMEAHAIGALVAPSVEITPEVPGHVEKIFFQDGTFVDKGTLLIQLDDAVYKAKYDSAMAKLTYSENNFKRMALLGKQGAISKQAIDQAEADLKEKKAEAKESAVMVNKMKLSAPFAGVVGQGRVNPGDYVTVGQSLVTLTDTKHLRVEYTVPEKYLSALKLHQKVNITSAAYPGKIFIGQVSYISPTINTDNRSVSLYADVVNDNSLLAAGMFVNVVQSLGSEERVLMIPARSLVPILDGEQVYKIMNGQAYAVTVLVGKRTENTVQVLQGLKVDDQVITDGQIKLKNGSFVKLKEKVA